MDSTKEDTSTEIIDEEEIKRNQRLEQEKADRLLAEEMQREERNSRLHLRERRGGRSVNSVPVSQTQPQVKEKERRTSGGAKDKDKDKNVSSTIKSENTKISPSVSGPTSTGSSVKKDKEKVRDKVKKRKKKRDSGGTAGRMTNNSLAAALLKNDTNTPIITDSEKDDLDDDDDDDELSMPPPSPRVPSSKDKLSRKTDAKAKAEKKKLLLNDKNAKKSQGMSKTKVKSSLIFSQNDEDFQIGMHKVIEGLKNHSDAWPFQNPVDEDYAPNYYRVIGEPMDLQTMEDKLDNQEYSSLEEFKSDFEKIVENCRKYNGPLSEYTEMVETLQNAFHKSIQRYIIPDESDDEISIEYSEAVRERKRPRLGSLINVVEEKVKREYKKENEPKIQQIKVDRKQQHKENEKIKKKSSESIVKKSRKYNKTKVVKEKDEKKKKKKSLLHKSRDSREIEALKEATAETLRDINKWLGETADPLKSSSNSSAASSTASMAIPTYKSLLHLKDKKPFSSKGDQKHHHHKHRVSSSSRSRSTSKDNSNKLGKSKKKSHKDKEKKFSAHLNHKDILSNAIKHKDKDSKSKISHSKMDKGDKSSTTKEKHRHKRDRSKSPKTSSTGAKKQKMSYSPPDEHLTTLSSSTISATIANIAKSFKDSSLKSIKGIAATSGDSTKGSTSTTTTTAAGGPKKYSKKDPSSSGANRKSQLLKRGNSFLNNMKGPWNMKRVLSSSSSSFAPRTNKLSISEGSNNGKSFSSTNNTTNNNSSSVYDFPASGSSNGSSEKEVSTGEVSATTKKKCLLITEGASGEGGSRLSLGSVLDKDSIKMPEMHQGDESVFSENGSDSDDKKPPTNTNNNEEENLDDFKDEELGDRKLEPSKGFNRDKCMPNLSAWIKAFGGPPKCSGATSPVKGKNKEDPKTK